MGQRSNDAFLEDAQTELRQEECVSGMGQSGSGAAVKDVQTALSKEECAKGMGQIAMQTMNLLHSDQNSNWLLQLNRNQISLLLNLPAGDEAEKAFLERSP